MRILLLNPNTTVTLTELMLRTGRAVASPGTELVGATAPRGLPYIATEAEAQIGGAIALEMLAEHAACVDAAIIAAFGDPGLLGARGLFDIPVVGLAEAAMLTACMLGRRFGIVTFSGALAPWYRETVERHGLGGRSAGVFALAGEFRRIDDVQAEKERLLLDLAARAVDDGADVLIFAGAPLSGLASRVKDRLLVPVVDQVAAAVRQAETLVTLAPELRRRRTRDPKAAAGLDPALAAALSRP